MTGTTAGAKFYIGTTEYSALDESSITPVNFGTDSFTEVKDVVDMGEFGDSASPVEVLTIGNSRVRRLKGARDAGQFDLIVLRNPLDAGQVAMIEAAGTAYSYNFKVVLNDAPPEGTPTTFFFRSPVFSARNQLGEADNVVRTVFSLSSNVGIIEVPAAEPVEP